MTAAPRFTVPRDDRRDCALYRIMVVHPVTGKIVLGYIGETGRTPFTPSCPRHGIQMEDR